MNRTMTTKIIAVSLKGLLSHPLIITTTVQHSLINFSLLILYLSQLKNCRAFSCLY